MSAVHLNNLFGLNGLLALVTDVGANASADVAKVLAEAGARVIIASDKLSLINALAEDICQGGGWAHAIAVDLESQDSVAGLFAQVTEHYGAPDIVVNCAALHANGALHQMPLEVWDEVQSVNLRSIFLSMRYSIDCFISAGKGGRIVNVTTMGARHPVLNGNGAYSASRAAVSALVRSAALDYASQSILINEVLPGAVPGKVTFHSSNPPPAEMTGPGTDTARRFPLGYGRAEDVAAAVLYLVGPSGSYMTGQSIVLDGGFLIS